MVIKRAADVPSSEMTDKQLYLRRREFIQAAAVPAVAALAGLSPFAISSVAAQTGAKLSGVQKGPFGTTETLTPYKAVTTYNNFYEFGTDKDSPAQFAGTLKTQPWTVNVEGHVGKPAAYHLDDIMKLHALEERVYRHRCVEGWSMVIPWVGFPLAELIKRVEPTSNAKYVEFTTLYDSHQMPGQKRDVLTWPYTEGLRLDEALNPLAILAVGLYGEVLPNQNGAPLRLVVPWKYGFKSIKSIVRIRFVGKEPPTAWDVANPREYGFYSNVNPQVDHPRWSQATERRIGEYGKRKTLMFNGYGDHVAHLYQGMDLRKYY